MSSDALRWICILPAAILGGKLAQFALGVILRIAANAGVLGDAGAAISPMAFLYYVPPKLFFVLIGAKIAPRYQVATAFVLAGLVILMSLWIHILGQLLVGNRVGIANYTHFSLESAGGLVGAALVYILERKRRQSASAP